MPIDPSIVLGVRPPENPLETQQRVLTLRTLAGQQQYQQEHLKTLAMQNELQRQAIADQQVLRQAWAQSGGDLDRVLESVAGKVSPDTMLKIQNSILEHKKALTQAKLEDLKLTQGHAQAVGNAAQGLLSLPPGQRQALYPGVRARLIQNGNISPADAPEFYPGDAWLQQHVANALTADKQIEAELNRRKTAAQEVTAASHAQQAVTSAQRLAAEQPGLEAQADARVRADIAAKLAGATNAEQYKAILEDLPLKYARTLPPPEQFDPAKTPAQVRMWGMTPAEQAVNIRQTMPNTPTELAMVANDPNAPPEQRAQAKQALRVLEQHAAASRPVTQFVAPPAMAGQQSATIDQVPENIRGQVKAIIEYRTPTPPLGRNNPTNQAINYWVNKVDPSYDATQFPARNKLRASFTSGKDADNITAINTAIGHLGTLYNAGKQLGNVNLRAYNTFANFLSREFGQSTVKPFQTARIGVSEELAKAFKGGIATEGEVKQWQNAIDAADSWPALQSAIQTATEMLASRVAALEDKYMRGMGKAPEQPLLSQKSTKVLSQMQGTGGAGDKKATHRFNPQTGNIEEVR